MPETAAQDHYARPLARWLAVLACLWLAPGLGNRFVRAATGQLELVVVDRDSGEPIACRMHLRTAKGQVRKPPGTPFWHDHFVVPGRITLKLPLGTYVFEIERGPEYLDQSGHFTIDRFADDSKTVQLRRFVDMSKHGWWSGDLDVRRPARDIELLMQAEDLHVAEVITWWNDSASGEGDSASGEGDSPIFAARKSGQSPAGEAGQSPGSSSPRDPLVAFDGDRYYHVLAGGHERPGGTWLYFNLPGPMPLDKAQGEYPPPTVFCGRARQHEGAWIDAACPFAWDLPMLVANGQVDSIQLANSELCRDTVTPPPSGGKPRDRTRYPGDWGDGRWAQDVYFNLLNCGLHIPPTAGSGSGRASNPVGYNRVYVHVDGELTYQKWWRNLRAGRVTVTNGPLLRPRVEGELPGCVFPGQAGRPLELEIALTLSTRDKISYLEIIKNGRVEHSVPLRDYSETGKLPKIVFNRSGWFLVRAVTDLEKTYRFAMTGPYYVEFDYQPRISKRAAQFFLDWVYERARQLQLDDLDQRRQVLEPHRKAHDFWQDLVDRANAE